MSLPIKCCICNKVIKGGEYSYYYSRLTGNELFEGFACSECGNVPLSILSTLNNPILIALEKSYNELE